MKQETNPSANQGHEANTMLAAVKTWVYEFINGHPYLLSEEVDIICRTRFDPKYKWMNDSQIQRLIQIRVDEMYKKKFPNARRFGLF